MPVMTPTGRPTASGSSSARTSPARSSPSSTSIRPDGSGLRQVTHVEEGTQLLSASFSPDGRSITFAMTGEGGEPDVFVMRADGRDVRPVTTTPVWESMPDWGLSH